MWNIFATKWVLWGPVGIYIYIISSITRYYEPLWAQRCIKAYIIKAQQALSVSNIIKKRKYYNTYFVLKIFLIQLHFVCHIMDLSNFSDYNSSLHLALNFTSHTVKSFQSPPNSSKVSFVILFVILETLGNFLLVCMANYEKFGMDPQKRTASNQLLRNNCFMWLLYNLSIMPIFMVHRVFGPQSKYISF